MEQTLITPEERRWRRSHAIAVLALICFYMLCPVAPLRWADAYESYGKILIISISAIYFYKCGLRGAIEVKLVIFYAIWLFITRLLNTDLYLQNELDLVLSRVLCAVVFPVGLLLDAKDRERLLDWFSAIVGGFYVIVAVLGLYAYLTDTFFTIPPEDAVFGINFPYYFCYLVLLGTSRTISSVWLYIGWCLMAYQFFRRRGWLWRIPIGAAWALFHISIAVAYCRSIMIIVGINAAMLAVLWLIKALRGRKNSLIVLLSALAIVITMPVVYKSFGLISDGLISLSAKVATGENSASDMFIETYSGSADDAYVDPRSFSDTAASGSPRRQIYASFIPTLKEDPMRILIGKYSDKIMQIPHRYMDYTYFHMHNYLLQTFMLTGILGFLIVLTFSVLLVKRTVMLFFSKHPDATLAIKALTLPITGFFVYAMFEILMFTGSADERSLTTDIRELSFFLLAGIVLGYAYELAPGRQKSK